MTPQAMNDVAFYIKPLEGEPSFPICACFRCGMLSCGTRNDWVRVGLSPVLPDQFPKGGSDIFAVATRFSGDSLDFSNLCPVHVYLVQLLNTVGNVSFSTKDIADLKWGTLHPTLHLATHWNSSLTAQYPWFPSQTIPLVIAGRFVRLTWSLVYYGFVHGYISIGDVQQHCQNEAERGTVSADAMSKILTPHSFSSFLAVIESLNQNDEGKMSMSDMETTWRTVYQVAKGHKTGAAMTARRYPS